MPDYMRFVHLPLMVLLLLASSMLWSCKTPTERFLTRKDGAWNIDTLHYQRSQDGVPQVDTTLVDAGDMVFVVKYDLEKDEDNRNFEGYIQEPREVWISYLITYYP